METDLANTNYSYYDGGQILGHLMDFAIRNATNNQKSLDDWMRLLYSRYALPKPGFDPDDPLRALNEVAGSGPVGLSSQFFPFARGKGQLPYKTYFGYAGIQVEKKIDPEKPWAGVRVQRGDDGHAHVTNIIPGGPAEQAGLDKDDVIVAIKNFAVNGENFNSAIAAAKPGVTLRFAVLRDGTLREISVAVASDPNPVYALKPMANPSDLQKRIYQSWLGIH